MKRIALLLIAAFLLLSVAGLFSQTSNFVATRIRAEESLRIGSSSSQKITGFDLVVPAIPTHFKLPTTKAVYDYITGSCVLNGSSASGDLSGTYPGPMVDGLQGFPVSNTTPSTGKVLKWNGSAWEPSDDNTGTTYTAGAGIDVTGTVISNTGLLTGTTFSGDVTGTYNNLQLGNGVVGSAEIANSSIVAGDISWPLLAPNGSAAAPSYAFSGGAGGMYATSKILGLQSLTGKKIKIAAANETGAGQDIEIFSGASSSATGGSLSIFSGNGVAGGLFQLSGGAGTDDVGGAFTMNAGNSTNGAGGGFIARAGNSTNATAGSFQMFAGSGANGGTFDMRGGDSTDGEGGAFNVYSGNSYIGGGGELSINSGEGIDYGGFFLLQGGSASAGTGADINIRPGNGATSPQNGKIIMTGNGMVPPPLTTAQRNALTGVMAGTILFCSDCTATDGSTGVTQTFSSSSWRNHY